MSNLFAAGDLLLARLATVTALRSVRYGSRIVGPVANDSALPNAILVPGEAENFAPDADPSSDKIHERQKWVVGIRVELDPASTAANSAEARISTLATDVIRALCITQRADGVKHVRYTQRTPMQYPEASGYAEVWLTFDLVAQIT